MSSPVINTDQKSLEESSLSTKLSSQPESSFRGRVVTMITSTREFVGTVAKTIQDFFIGIMNQINASWEEFKAEAEKNAAEKKKPHIHMIRESFVEAKNEIEKLNDDFKEEELTEIVTKLEKEINSCQQTFLRNSIESSIRLAHVSIKVRTKLITRKREELDNASEEEKSKIMIQINTHRKALTELKPTILKTISDQINEIDSYLRIKT